MALTDQKKRFLKAKIAVSLQNEPGRVHTEEEINNVFLLSRVIYKAVLGLHLTRQREPEEENAEDQKQQISRATLYLYIRTGQKDTFSSISISQPTLSLSARLDPKSPRSSFGIFLLQPSQKNHLVRAGAASCRFALLAHR